MDILSYVHSTHMFTAVYVVGLEQFEASGGHLLTGILQ